MQYKLEELVSYASLGETLYPGEIIGYYFLNIN
jgi:2-keto-4-pentenoate hydratase/2-oxohepta-3-ene-1,7-dioic acid hydratase in catechol pathway